MVYVVYDELMLSLVGRKHRLTVLWEMFCYVAVTPLLTSGGEDDLLGVQTEQQTGRKVTKVNLNVTRLLISQQAALSISESDDLLGFSHKTISRVSKKKPSEKEKTSRGK